MEGATGYNDLDNTHHHRAIKVTAETDGNFTDLWRIEPAGGLDRGEVAELVALDVESFFMRAENPTGGNQVKGSVEFSQSAEAVFAEDRFRTDVNELEAESGTITDSLGTFIDSGNSPAEPIAYFESEGNGGTTDFEPNPSIVFLRNFREMFGQGPLFDRRDDFIEHYQMNTSAFAANSCSIEMDFALYWDVHEASDLDLSL